MYVFIIFVVGVITLLLFLYHKKYQKPQSQVKQAPPSYVKEFNLQGWQVFVNKDLIKKNPESVEKTLQLMDKQLETIVERIKSKRVLNFLQNVIFWVSPPYKNFSPTAEYHPNKDWLVSNNRDPLMWKHMEITNSDTFAEETVRMPLFLLHEMAHAYHDQVLGNDAEILDAYSSAKQSGIYNAVQRKHADGRITVEPAYALVNEKEYFSELTEALFDSNDYYPFKASELKLHDPKGFDIVSKKWELY